MLAIGDVGALQKNCHAACHPFSCHAGLSDFANTKQILLARLSGAILDTGWRQHTVGSLLFLCCVLFVGAIVLLMVVMIAMTMVVLVKAVVAVCSTAAWDASGDVSCNDIDDYDINASDVDSVGGGGGGGTDD